MLTPIELQPAVPLGMVTPEAFDRIESFARRYGQIRGSETRISLTMNPDGEVTEILRSDGLASEIIVRDNSEAVMAISPFLVAAKGWLLDDVDEIDLSYKKGAVLPEQTLRESGWHLDNLGFNNVRAAMFTDIDPTDIAVGKLDSSVSSLLEILLGPEKHDEATEKNFEVLLEEALALGKIAVERASQIYQGAGIDQLTVHSAHPNHRETPVVKSFLRLTSFHKN